MVYDFDKMVDRRGTSSSKWEECRDGMLPFWVADMDFETANEIKEAIIERAKHPIYGYTKRSDSFFDSVKGWMKKRHDWEIQSEWICISPGVVPALNLIVREFCNPGDRIVVQQPVYYPFMNSIRRNGCEVVSSPLKLKDGRYEMDFEDLEEKLAHPRVRMMLLCSPHNPVGRVWTRDELQRLGEICIKNRITVVSDEIHSDIVYSPSVHIPFASICESFRENSITCTAPSKTFNIAGLQVSNIIIPNAQLRERYQISLENIGVSRLNIFGMAACEAAYTYGRDWLEQLLEYLRGNIDYAQNFIDEYMPKLRLIRPEGTYLLWIDFTALGLEKHELENLMLDGAKVMLDEGYIFGDEGAGFERINIACPRFLLEKCLLRIQKVYDEIIVK